jgi:hypothetical protein
VWNIDAGAAGGRYSLVTGSDVEHRTTKLRDTIIRDTGTPAAEPPADLPKFE